MLLIQSWGPYYLSIPPQYHNAATLRSFVSLDKVFYQRETQYYFQKALATSLHFHEINFFYELILRGCLIRSKHLVKVARWKYLYVPESTNDCSVSHLILKFLPKKSPIIPLIYRQTNDYFHLMPLDCLHCFTEGLSVEAFQRKLDGLIEVVTLKSLKSEPIMQSTQLRSFHRNFELRESCRRFFINEGYFYYEDLADFNWQLLLKLPCNNEQQIQRILQRHSAAFMTNLSD